MAQGTEFWRNCTCPTIASLGMVLPGPQTLCIPSCKARIGSIHAEDTNWDRSKREDCYVMAERLPATDIKAKVRFATAPVRVKVFLREVIRCIAVAASERGRRTYIYIYYYYYSYFFYDYHYYLCIYKYVHTCIHAYILKQRAYNMCIHTYTHTCIHAYVHTYIHTYIRAYIHT